MVARPAEGQARPGHVVRRAGWLVGAVAGVVVGVLLGISTQSWQESREARDIERRAEEFARTDVVPPPGDAVRALLEQDSLVVVDPLLADRLPTEDVGRAEAILEGADVPARIAYLTYPGTPREGYTNSGAPVQWSTGVGEVGHYTVLWDTGFADTVAVGLEPPYLQSRVEGRPGPALVRVAEEMVTWGAEPLPSEPREPSRNDYWGAGGGVAALLFVGAFVVLPLFALLRWYVGSRRRKVT
ncbi:hypothetical protein GCM10011376_24770 [Nocardioides flavus (ex Wang et al. 2016)]|uniref:Uncharacterized protein n=1 Tax=Nocardioides flavus (ex Wang et al. 2016) TaxID=2058780 RepID=A0ABQ3HN69_9ACTN|nr:hypothetical protein [Nocardioides flavus (ex Wang et al. 2016)]GHE17867.1 hypothetical protein GCM10011376_24770 [Nocardioides flavus (ex Wang et al. 2016)]